MAEKKSVRCIIISGSPDCNTEFIKSYIQQNDFIICADKGYEYAQKANIIPHIIVGDFDSYKGEYSDSEIIRLNTHKDDTDTEHCVHIAVEKGYKNIIILGATGGRQDHNYGNLCLLKYLSDNSVNGIIINEYETIEVKSAGKYEYHNLNGVTFSVFPFACNEAVVSYYGKCEYNGENINLSSSNTLGISNVFRSDDVTIEVIKGNVLIFTEKISYL